MHPYPGTQHRTQPPAFEDLEGAAVIRQACVMGLEGIVAKHRVLLAGRCREGMNGSPPFAGVLNKTCDGLCVSVLISRN
jgi:hypothetical protein